ncbi:hypothetical protein HRbin36_01563 [bacterium HR36]|nr:hypothetical protein HRbin36_01563 [bacterium HR36]
MANRELYLERIAARIRIGNTDTVVVGGGEGEARILVNNQRSWTANQQTYRRRRYSDTDGGCARAHLRTTCSRRSQVLQSKAQRYQTGKTGGWVKLYAVVQSRYQVAKRADASDKTRPIVAQNQAAWNQECQGTGINTSGELDDIGRGHVCIEDLNRVASTRGQH